MTQDQGIKTVPTLLPGTYRLEPDSTTLHFSARKFGMFTIRGTMKLTRGTFTVADPVERSTVHAILAADTFTTPMAKRDEHVRSYKLLDAISFPAIEFLGTSVTPSPPGWSVLGSLSVHGQQQNVALAISEVNDLGDIIRIAAHTQVDRNDFGVTGMRVAAGPKIDIRIDAVATRI
jgi:polyisoprenoid-binding protein YceI